MLVWLEINTEIL